MAAAPPKATPDVVKVVAGPAALSLSQHFHFTEGCLWPSLLSRGGKPETLFKFRIECGVPIDPIELISAVSLEAVGQKTNQTP